MNETTIPAAEFQSPAVEPEIVEVPRGAVIELLERHPGPKMPYIGTDSILCPNTMRINGVVVYATQDEPAVLKETYVSGEPRVPFAVVVQLLARAVTVGEPLFLAPEELVSAGQTRGAVVEIPGVDEFAAGDLLRRPYVLLNGHRLYTEGDIVVGELATDGDKRSAAIVTLTLLCRQLVVDDESTDPDTP